MLTLLRNRLGDEPTDAGVTLTELLVSMALSMIIGAMALMLFVNAGDTTTDITDRTIGSSQARNVLQSWASYLQVADGPTAGNASHRFEWITPTDVMFHAGIGNRDGTASSTGTPDLVWLRLAGGRLVEEQFPGAPSSYPVAPTVCRVLAEKVTANQLFAPIDLQDGPLAGDTGTSLAPSGDACVPLTGPVTQPDNTVATNLTNVSAVAIQFSITDGRGKHTQEYSTVATVPTLTGAP